MRGSPRYRWIGSRRSYHGLQDGIRKTGTFYGGPGAKPKVEGHAPGWYQARIEARLPFEMVHDRLLDEAHLARLRTPILPNIAALSDQRCRQPRAFGRAGRGPVARYETSLHDERGGRRADFGLAELFGVWFPRRAEGPMRNACPGLEADPRTGRRHPLLAGLDEASRVIHRAWRLEVAPRIEFGDRPLTPIPSYPDLPMEMAYPRVARTDVAEAYLREAGPGRVAYFPWDIDGVFWEALAVDHVRRLGDALRWAAAEASPVEVVGPGVLDVTAWRQEGSMAVHLVNLTNPRMMKGPCRELIPVGEQRVTVRLPAGVRARRVQLLVAGREVPVARDGTRLTVAVPSVRDLEVVAIDL